MTSHNEAASSLKGSVIPTLNRLLTEIKNKEKEIVKGAGKGSKLVDRARNATQRQIEMLGQYTAAFDSAGGRVGAAEDPYVLQRNVYHKLHKQIIEENSNRQDLLAVQNNFSQFEAHILKTVQHAMGSFMQIIIRQVEHSKSMYGDMVATSQRVPLNFEWNNFVKRNNEILIDPSIPPRSVSNLGFPNQDHPGTVPLIAGSLEKRSKVLKRYEPGYYAVTPAKFLHEYKTDDNYTQEPTPEISLYLPECIVGALDGSVFVVKGKDASRGRIGSTFAMNHEFQFRAHTPKDAQMWWELIRSAAGHTTSERPDMSATSTPVDARPPNELPLRQKEEIPQSSHVVTNPAPMTSGQGEISPIEQGAPSSTGATVGTGVPTTEVYNTEKH